MPFTDCQDTLRNKSDLSLKEKERQIAQQISATSCPNLWQNRSCQPLSFQKCYRSNVSLVTIKRSRRNCRNNEHGISACLPKRKCEAAKGWQAGRLAEKQETSLKICSCVIGGFRSEEPMKISGKATSQSRQNGDSVTVS